MEDGPLSERRLANFVPRMVILVLALSVAGLVACDRKAKPRDTLFIAPTLQPLVAKFEEKAAEQGRTIDIKNLYAQLTEALAEGVNGECNAGDGTPIVKIAKAFWENASLGAQELVLFHELGHCVLDRVHDEDVIFLNSAYIPKTIMTSVEVDTAVFLANYDYYIQELFKTRP